MWNWIKSLFRRETRWTVEIGRQVGVDGHRYVVTEIVWRAEQNKMITDIRLTSADYIRQQMDLHGR